MLLLLGGKQGFDPTSIAGNTGWWDANDSSTLTLGAANVVDQWDDKSTLGTNTLTPPATKPVWGSGSLHGSVAAVKFTGAEKLQATGDVTLSDHTIVIVYKSLDITTTGQNLVSSTGIDVSHTGTTANVSYNDGSVKSIAAPQVDAQILSFRFGSNGEVYRKGQSLGSSTYTQVGIGTLDVGDGLVGNIAEIATYNRAISDTELEKLEHYLCSKNGLSYWSDLTKWATWMNDYELVRRVGFWQHNTFESDPGNNALRLWLDAEDSSTITKDASNRVSLWSSKSNKPGDAVQSTNLKKPVQPSYIPLWENTHSILMDGVDEYAAVPSAVSSALNGKAGGSFSCWLKRSSVGGSRRYFLGLSIDAAGSKIGMNFETNNRIRLLAQSSVADGLKLAITTESVASTSAWYNITACVDITGDAWDVYIDGVASTLAAPTFGDSVFSSEVGSNHNIGAWVTNGITFPGNMNQCAVWDKCLSAAEALEIYNSGVPADLEDHSAASNIVGYWPFGTGDTYPTLLDSVNSHDGTMTNMESGDIVTDVP